MFVRGEISGDDAAIVRLDKSVGDFSDLVSDHVPVVFRMILRSEEMKIEPSAAAAVNKIELPEGAKSIEIIFKQ